MFDPERKPANSAGSAHRYMLNIDLCANILNCRSC